MRQYAVVLIKPDAIRDILEELILKDLRKDAHVIPIFRKFWKVTENLTKLMYPAWLAKQEFPSMVHNITQGNSLFVVVSGNRHIYKSLTQTKGKMNQGGLRLKYRTHSIEEWQSLGCFGRELQNKIAENRLHTTDNFDETVFLCNLALDHYDLATLELTAPSLVASIRRKRTVQTVS